MIELRQAPPKGMEHQNFRVAKDIETRQQRYKIEVKYCFLHIQYLQFNILFLTNFLSAIFLISSVNGSVATEQSSLSPDILSIATPQNIA